MRKRTEVHGMKERTGRMRLRGGVLFALTILLAVTLAGCSSGGSRKSEDHSSMSAANQAAPAAPAAKEAAELPPIDMGAAMQADAAVHDVKGAAEGQLATEGSAAANTSASLGALGDTAGLNRKVIYKANVSMKVEDFLAADEKLRDAIHLNGAYILQFNNTLSANEKGATYVVKVPADGFSSFLDQLREIQQDLQLQMEGSDVTEEYVDLDARLKAKQAAEARLLAFMDKATKTDDLVRFQSELASVQEQIEQLKGRMRYLDQNVAYSTVNIRIYEGKADVKQDEPAQSGLGDRLSDALTGSAKVLGQFGQALLIFFAALLPVLAVAAIVGIPVYLIVRRQQRIRREASAEKRRMWNQADGSAPVRIEETVRKDDDPLSGPDQ